MITADVCTALDVLANNSEAVADTGAALDDKIRLAVEEWLEPRLRAHGYVPAQHRTRRQPDMVLASTGGAWSDVTGRARGTAPELSLAAILATPSTDALYIGLDRPFRGLFVNMTDTLNSNAIAASLTYWNGKWSSPASVANGTVYNSAPFGRAGRIVWPTPIDWIARAVGGETTARYWVRLQVNSVPGASLVSQLLPITRSRLTQAVALRALGYLHTESISAGRGEWKELAEKCEKQADEQLQIVIGQVQDEFDVDADGAVAATEVNSVTPLPWTWERG
jgi:hypothetical protein